MDFRLYRITLLALLTLFLLLGISGCGSSMRHYHHRYSMGQDSAPDFHIDVSKIHNAVPCCEPLSKYGNPHSYVACGHRYYVMSRAQARGYDERGIASWYGMKFYKFRTSSGEPYDVAQMTAAHKTLPLPTYVQVTNLHNGRQIIVKVNDRGPFVANRIIDLSYAAAIKLGVYPRGTALVDVKAINPSTWRGHPLGVVTHVRPEHPHIYLQVGAFGMRDNAENLAARVKHWTDCPVIICKEGHLYKVLVGPLPNVNTSDYLYHHLQRAHLGKPVTVVR
jgi:rare lipoprotein A